VRAAAAGTVVIAAKLSYGYGWRIKIDHGGGYSTLYAHLSSFSVGEGDRIARGQVIGAVGRTGLATGPHLHFEILVNGQPVDPLKLLP
jgi:murein DD-endopeptidase MepM/ murein hydrolase activator NlpD